MGITVVVGCGVVAVVVVGGGTTLVAVGGSEVTEEHAAATSNRNASPARIFMAGNLAATGLRQSPQNLIVIDLDFLEHTLPI